MNKIGQVAPDYLVAIIFLGIMALTAFGAYAHLDSQVYTTIEQLNAKDVAETMVKGINSVVIMGDGGQKSITLPKYLGNGQEYNLTIIANAILVRWGSNDYAYRFSTANMEQKRVELPPGEILITNANGKIRFEWII